MSLLLYISFSSEVPYPCLPSVTMRTTMFFSVNLLISSSVIFSRGIYIATNNNSLFTYPWLFLVGLPQNSMCSKDQRYLIQLTFPYVSLWLDHSSHNPVLTIQLFSHFSSYQVKTKREDNRKTGDYNYLISCRERNSSKLYTQSSRRLIFLSLTIR